MDNFDELRMTHWTKIDNPNINNLETYWDITKNHIWLVNPLNLKMGAIKPITLNDFENIIQYNELDMSLFNYDNQPSKYEL